MVSMRERSWIIELHIDGNWVSVDWDGPDTRSGVIEYIQRKGWQIDYKCSSLKFTNPCEWERIEIEYELKRREDLRKQYGIATYEEAVRIRDREMGEHMEAMGHAMGVAMTQSIINALRQATTTKEGEDDDNEETV